MTKIIQSLTAGLVLCVASSITNADLVLDLTPVGSTTVTSGGTVDVQMLLRDTDNSHFGPTAGPGMSAVGLLNGGGKLIQSATGGATASITATAAGADFVNAVPQNALTLQTPGLGGVLAAPAVNFLTGAGIGTGVAHIATFTLQVMGAAGTDVTISSDTLGLNFLGSLPVEGNTTLQTATNLDAILTDFATTPGNFDSVTLTVSAAVIPEPSTIFAALCIVGGVVVARRRRRSVSAEQ